MIRQSYYYSRGPIFSQTPLWSLQVGPTYVNWVRSFVPRRLVWTSNFANKNDIEIAGKRFKQVENFSAGSENPGKLRMPRVFRIGLGVYRVIGLRLLRSSLRWRLWFRDLKVYVGIWGFQKGSPPFLHCSSPKCSGHPFKDPYFFKSTQKVRIIEYGSEIQYLRHFVTRFSRG